MAWLGLDDTDSLDGGCTTEMFVRLLERMGVEYDDPRLVRLWPFAENRTRGNAAVAANLKISFDEAVNLVEEHWIWLCERSEPDSNPGMVLTEEQLDESIYWNAVRMHVESTDIDTPIRHHLWSTGGTGVIGATAAIAWRGIQDHTWENTVYRSAENIGSPRRIDENSIAEMDKKFPGTFLNRDPRKQKGLIAPRSPCPVLLGIRGETEDDVRSAFEWLRNNGDMEEDAGNMVWRTNQACDDHIGSVITATVETTPVVRTNGHASASTSEGDIVAFSEGGDVNKLLQGLIPGDVISWLGLEHLGVYHLERLRLVKAALRFKQRPMCHCGKRMKSAGKGQSPRCPTCGTQSEVDWIGEHIEPSEWMEPAPDRRRHLAAPLERKIPKDDIDLKSHI
ncbi:MAG: DUF1743 domain-containing protein [Candidatus Poseidoniaceae archaeon]|nr:DUF1743 domain-containing protein [Candidatus Poseidoniaceae archaeon]